MEDFATCGEGLEDPRTGNARLRDFHGISMMALCAVLCGAQGAADMALFAASKEPFLRGLTPNNGVPSHDTSSRLVRQLDPEQFGLAFGRFMASFSEAYAGGCGDRWRGVAAVLRPGQRPVPSAHGERMGL